MISFIPPDGDFELISYRLDVRVKPLFSVDVIVERKSNAKIEFLIKAKSNFKSKSTANTKPDPRYVEIALKGAQENGIKELIDTLEKVRQSI